MFDSARRGGQYCRGGVPVSYIGADTIPDHQQRPSVAALLPPTHRQEDAAVIVKDFDLLVAPEDSSVCAIQGVHEHAAVFAVVRGGEKFAIPVAVKVRPGHDAIGLRRKPILIHAGKRPFPAHFASGAVEKFHTANMVLAIDKGNHDLPSSLFIQSDDRRPIPVGGQHAAKSANGINIL